MPGENDPGLAMAQSMMSEELKKSFAAPTSGPHEPSEASKGAVAYPPHQQRVFIERNDLEEKLGKLRSFFNSSTYAAMADTQSGRDEQDRLQEQADVMDRYRAILVDRIAAF